MKIYAIYGTGNSGKTTVLKNLDTAIKQKYELVSDAAYIYDNRKIYSDDSLDYAVFYDIKLNNEIVRIGIATQGDAAEQVKKGFGELAKEKCDIIFCACRTKGGSVRETNLIATSLNVKKVRWIAKADQRVWRDEIGNDAASKLDAAFVSYIMSVSNL